MKNIIQWRLMAVALTLITACSNDNPAAVVPADTIQGTAAVGLPVDGTVTVVDANGVKVTEMTDPTTGNYSVQVPGMTPPFMIQVVPTAGGDTLYSFADAPGQIVNVTPFTSLTLSLAANGSDLSMLFSAWDGTALSQTQIESAQAIVGANLTSQLSAAGVDASAIDFFNDAFNADGTGIDAVLDNLTFTTDSNGAIMVADSTDSSFTFDPNISVGSSSGGSSTGGNSTGGNSTGGGSTGGGSGSSNIANSDATIEANEELATIPAEVAGTYNFTFTESLSGSGIADGTQTKFVVATDGTLTIDDTLVLGNPVFRGGNGFEAIWKDTQNGLEYALSALPTTAFGTDFPANIREINIGAPESGIAFYGQYH